MPKCDLSNVKPVSLSFYVCSICTKNSTLPTRKMIKHVAHDGPMITLTTEQIDAWWAVRDVYPDVREWWLNQ